MADWIGVISTLIAGAGLFFAGRQFMLGNRQVREERLLGLAGVVVHWRPLDVPAPADVDADGNAVWSYEIIVQNPGRFAIDRVQVRWVFPISLEHIRHDGSTEAGPTTELILSATPVVPGSGTRQWRRRLRMQYAERHRLAEVFAEVSFYDIDGLWRVNRWPRHVDRKPGDDLAQRATR